jgi:hypothetical protein
MDVPKTYEKGSEIIEIPFLAKCQPSSGHDGPKQLPQHTNHRTQNNTQTLSNTNYGGMDPKKYIYRPNTNLVLAIDCYMELYIDNLVILLRICIFLTHSPLLNSILDLLEASGYH